MTDEAKALVAQAVRQLKLSARVYVRMLKLARTIADLAATDVIDVPTVAEALQYRPALTEGIT